MLSKPSSYLPNAMSFFVRHRSNGTPVFAAQWYPGREVAGVDHEWPGHPGGNGLLPSPPHAYLVTPQGRFTLFAGDWVITEPEGRMHVCHDFLFRQCYAPVENAENPPQAHPVAAARG